MKKYLLVSLLALSFLFVPATSILAQTDLSQDIANKSGYGQAGASTLSETAGKIIKAVLGVLGVLFLALTVYAGFLWMTAAGNDEQITKAMGILKTAIIGLVIILVSYSLTYFILGEVFKATM
ncbi:MAG: hypothetical protein HYT15_03145 [Candidatus Magasanikbacteria bacterium]|nr:hypothetical protein [Candidatus Magasanikbacteria bacterium]